MNWLQILTLFMVFGLSYGVANSKTVDMRSGYWIATVCILTSVCYVPFALSINTNPNVTYWPIGILVAVVGTMVTACVSDCDSGGPW